MPAVEDVEVEEVKKDIEKAYGAWFKSYMKIFCRRALEWFVVYMLGYSNASFAWLLAPLFFLVLREKRAKEKKVKFDIVRSLANSDEKEFLQEIQRFSNLPSWVTFPDMERVEWVNKIIRQLWPYAGQYAKDLCRDMIGPCILDALKDYKISVFKFEKIILGDIPPRFSGMKVYDDTSRHEIIMDADFIYAGDCKFEVAISKIKAGIKDLQVSGRVRVVMRPLVRQFPLVGGLQVFFLNNPEVDFNLIGIADVFDMPGLSDILRGIVVEQIANIMVLPNRYPIQLVEDINMVELKCPAPAGVIRLHVLEAQNLMKKDIGVLGMGKSDPYCVIRLGAQKFQTKTINNSVNPKWDYCCEYISSSTTGQSLEFELFDLDDGPSKDEFLGRANLDVYSIYSAGEVDMWVPLSDAKSGRLHVKATWLDLADTAGALEDQLSEIRSLQTETKNPLHSAVLMVWVDSATKLNPPYKNIPDPYVRVHVGNAKEDTAVHLRTNDPVFEEGFTFLVRNPKTQEVQLDVLDQRTSQKQGRLEVDLNTLLKMKGLEQLGEEFSLGGAVGGMATMKLTLTLRILKSKTVDKGETAKLTKMASVTDGDDGEPTSSPAVSTPSKEPTAIPASEAKETDLLVEQETDSPSLSEGLKESDTTTSTVAATLSSSPRSQFEENQLRQRQVFASGEHGLGRIQLTVTYGPRNNLVIVVHRIEKLPLESDGEIPDPYVKLYLLPDRSKDSKRKTDVIKDATDATFDERFEYAGVAPNELTQRTLQVSVVNKKGFFHMQKSATLGQVHIDCGLLDPSEVTRWYDLEPSTDEDED